MPVSEFRVYLENEGLSEEMLDRFAEIQVDQAIGMAAEAELRLDLAADAGGNWNDVEEDIAQPMRRVRVEVRIGNGDFVPLIDGQVVTQRFAFHAAPDRSALTLVVQDDSVLLQREEKVEAFEDRTPDEIARELIEGAGLEAETESVPDAGSSFSRFYLRRGTAMSALRELARRRGMFVYVRAGAQPGASVVVFARPNLAASALPELLLMGASRNVNELSIEFDALRLAAAEAGSVRIADKAVLAASAAASNLEPLGDRPAHDVVEAARVLLARTREEQTDLDEAVQAAVNLSSWAYTARGEVTADTYTGVLQAHSVVPVAGVGAVLSGNYLVSRVTHTLDFDSYRQRFTLLRNARLDGSSGGGLPAGVF